jgi:hypothetical protein
MALNRAQFLAQIGARLDIDTSAGGELEPFVVQNLNMAARRVWLSRKWHFRRKDSLFTTVLPYTTGTVALTNGSTAVTGAATVWTATHTGYKMALDYGAPWYRFTRTAGTTGTLDRAYAEDNETASTYVLFQDEFNLGTDITSVDAVYLFYGTDNGRMKQLTAKAMDDAAFVHGITGVPYAYSVITDQTAGTTRVRLYPIPNSTYGVRVQYHKSCTNFTSTSATLPDGMKDDCDEAVLEAACLICQSLPTAQAVTNDAMVEAVIERTWQNLQKNQVLVGRGKPFDYYGEAGYVAGQITVP